MPYGREVDVMRQNNQDFDFQDILAGVEVSDYFSRCWVNQVVKLHLDSDSK
jgi:hypothetical protein